MQLSELRKIIVNQIIQEYVDYDMSNLDTAASESDDPDIAEIVRMADILGVDPNAVVGACLRLWIWADQQTSTGCALSVTRKWLNRLMQLDDAADAMIEVGWLSGVDGDLTLTNYSRHNGKPAKTRAQAAQRMKKARSE